MQITTTAENRRLVADGNIILSASEISFGLRIEDLEFRFRFSSDDGAMRVSQEVDEKKVGVYILYNFHQPTTTYIVDDAATIGAESISLRLFISRVDGRHGVTRLVAYSVLVS